MKIITKIIKKVNEDKDIFVRAVPGVDVLSNGSIIIFNYGDLGERIGMVVLSSPPGKKTKMTVWNSEKTGNTLVNVIKIDSIISEVTDTISKNLKNKGALSVKQFSGLKALVGSGSFRTYNLSKIRNLYKLYYINKKSKVVKENKI